MTPSHHGRMSGQLQRLMGRPVYLSAYITKEDDEYVAQSYERPLLWRLICGRTVDPVPVTKTVPGDVLQMPDGFVMHPATWNLIQHAEAEPHE